MFLVGQNGTVTISANGIPTPTVSVAGTLPAGLTFAPAPGAVTIAGTPDAGTAGSYPLTITTISAAGVQTQDLVLTVAIPPQFTSPASAIAVTGTPFTFAVTTTGSPAPTVALTGTLPTGVVFDSATATLSGAASAATAGQQFPVTLTATNVGGVATQQFVLTVHSLPAFTSATAAIAVTGTPFSFAVTATGSPAPSITMTGTLPTGITFNTATAMLSGTASAATAGQQFPVTFTATNAAGVATQQFTLTVHSVPAFTSATAAIAVVGAPFSFTVTANGAPAPSITMTGTLPTGITFNTATATLSGTASAAAAGQQFPVTLTATNVAGVATQQFTLSVTRIPQITSNSSAVAIAGVPFSFTVTSAGSPTASITQAGQLPAGISFTAGTGGTAKLSGTASNADTGRNFAMTFTVTNSAGASTQNFTLTINSVPTFNSTTSATAVAGVPFSFLVTTAGSPTPAITPTGLLPTGITFTPNPNGTATLAGVASTQQAGQHFALTFTAINSAGVATQQFSLAVARVPQFASLDSASAVSGVPFTFTAASVGSPTPAVTISGALPAGITFSPHSDGTATLAGTASRGSGRTQLSHHPDREQPGRSHHAGVRPHRQRGLHGVGVVDPGAARPTHVPASQRWTGCSPVKAFVSVDRRWTCSSPVAAGSPMTPPRSR